jgi:hypothetical protein
MTHDNTNLLVDLDTHCGSTVLDILGYYLFYLSLKVLFLHAGLLCRTTYVEAIPTLKKKTSRTKYMAS